MRFLLMFVAGAVFAEHLPWEASKIHGTPEPTPLFHLEHAFPQLNFTNPVELTWAPKFKRFMFVELGTKVHLFANDPKATDTTVLLDHILHPSKVIHPEFQLRKAGDHVGLIMRRTERELILREAAGQQHTLPPNTNTQVLPTSTMPPGLLATLTTQQAADLMAYLRSLK